MKVTGKAILKLIATASVLFAACVWTRWRPAQRFEFNERKNDTFRIVTWNVGYFTLVNNKNMRDVDLGEVTLILKKASPDVIVLQELGDLEQPGYIADQLGPEWRAYSCETSHGSQVISVLTRLDVIKEDQVACGGRKTVGLAVSDPKGRTLYVLGIHAPHPVRGIEKNFRSIQSALSYASSKDEDISIVAGDFNYNFDINSTEGYYSEILDDFGDSTASIGETYYAHTRIDHVFHKPHDLRVLAEESGIINLDMRFANVPGFRDHRPIVVTYKFEPAADKQQNHSGLARSR
jgi:endonuclease/exonuclease/phosphatase family metal-dependent hydrolase